MRRLPVLRVLSRHDGVATSLRLKRSVLSRIQSVARHRISHALETDDDNKWRSSCEMVNIVHNKFFKSVSLYSVSDGRVVIIGALYSSVSKKKIFSFRLATMYYLFAMLLKFRSVNQLHSDSDDIINLSVSGHIAFALSSGWSKHRGSALHHHRVRGRGGIDWRTVKIVSGLKVLYKIKGGQ